MNPNEKAKREFIGAFFDRASQRLDLLPELHRAGHRQEALTLCLTYIDSFSQWLRWPSTTSGRNLVEATIEYGGSDFMRLLHPLELMRSLTAMKGHWPAWSKRIRVAFPGPSIALHRCSEFEGCIAPRFTAAELGVLRKELWRGTIAHVAYKYLRNPSVHAFGTSDGIWFSGTTFRDAPVPPLGFDQMFGVLQGLIAEARWRSESKVSGLVMTEWSSEIPRRTMDSKRVPLKSHSTLSL